jgi:hypothetical protein
MSRLTTNDIPQSSRLHEIIVSDMAGVVRDFTDPFLVFRVQGQRLGLDAFDLWVELGCVGWELLVVYADAAACCVGVGE